MSDPIGEVVRSAKALCEELAIEYTFIGGVTLGVHKAPRLTTDADLLLFAGDQEIDRILEAAGRRGFRPTPDAATLWRTKGIIRLELGATHLDVIQAGTEYEQQVRQRAFRAVIFGHEVRIASAEDIVLLKLAAHRARDLADVEGVFKAQGTALAAGYMKRWAAWLAARLRKPQIVTELDRLLDEWGR